MKKFDFRKLFPFSYQRYKQGKDFNAFIFYIDIFIYAVPLSILLANILTHYI